MSQPPQPPDGRDREGPPAPAGPTGLDAATTHLGVRDTDDDLPHDPRRSEVPDSEHDPSLEGMGSRLRSGAKFASVALIFTQLISLGQTIVVARILSPAEIGVFTDRSTGTGIVVCALDNLGKGAAGQAVQNANLALGLEETAGLRLQGVLV